MEEISHYDERGVAWYWNNFSVGEHTGTHFDAPVHWVTGKDLKNNTLDTIVPNDFIAPAVVIDCSQAMRGEPRLPALQHGHRRLGERAWQESRLARGY